MPIKTDGNGGGGLACSLLGLAAMNVMGNGGGDWLVIARSGRYECDDCGRRFARSGDLNRHYREAHFISTDDEEY